MKQQRRSRWVPAKPERYMQGVEEELAFLAEVDRGASDDIRVQIGAATAVAKASLANASVGLANASVGLKQVEALEGLGVVLSQIGELFAMHPVFSHVMATRQMIAERNAEMERLNDEIAQLRLTVEAMQPPKENADDRKPN